MVKNKVGDIFKINLANEHVRYFQHVCDDSSQLNSNVIRVFKKIYKKNELISNETIVNDDVDFYAHCFIKIGAKLGYWQKYANSENVGSLNIMFRNTNDYGKPDVKISKNWYVWIVNGEFKKIGVLNDIYKDAEIGVVISPDSIVYKVINNKYDFVYPQP